MSNKAKSADNQQGTLIIIRDSSETTSQSPFSKSELKAYLLGALHDGTFSCNKRFRFSQKGIEWLKVLQNFLKNLGYNSWIYKEGKNRNEMYILETLAKFLDFKFNPLKLKSKKEKISYLRGFFDAEGGIPKNKRDDFYIQLVQNEKSKLIKLKNILNNLDINTGKIHNPSKKVDPDYWRMFISADSRKKFVKTINSWHPRKLKTLRKRMKI